MLGTKPHPPDLKVFGYKECRSEIGFPQKKNWGRHELYPANGPADLGRNILQPMNPSCKAVEEAGSPMQCSQGEALG